MLETCGSAGADALLALSAAARAREHRRIAREETAAAS